MAGRHTRLSIPPRSLYEHNIKIYGSVNLLRYKYAITGGKWTTAFWRVEPSPHRKTASRPLQKPPSTLNGRNPNGFHNHFSEPNAESTITLYFHYLITSLHCITLMPSIATPESGPPHRAMEICRPYSTRFSLCTYRIHGVCIIVDM